MKKMYLFLIALTIMSCFDPSTRQVKEQPIISEEMLPQSCEGTKALMQNPKSYGIVIGDATGVINSASSEGDVINVSYEVGESASSIQGKCTSNKWQSGGQPEITLQFNVDGTAKGKDKEGNDVYLLLGERSTDDKVIADLKKKNLLSLATGLVTKNELPGHDAPTWYYYQGVDRLQISFVFPVGFVHPSYGAQRHVRIVVFEKANDKWTIKEDNSSVQ